MKGSFYFVTKNLYTSHWYVAYDVVYDVVYDVMYDVVYDVVDDVMCDVVYDIQSKDMMISCAFSCIMERRMSCCVCRNEHAVNGNIMMRYKIILEIVTVEGT